MQPRSVAGFKSFVIDRQPNDDLPPHIQGAARWLEVRDEEGYWVYNPLNSEYLAVEYDEANDQWYFVSQDSQTNHWVAIDTVPATFNLGRRTRPTSVRAAEVDKGRTFPFLPTQVMHLSIQLCQPRLCKLRLLPRPQWQVTWHLQAD